MTGDSTAYPAFEAFRAAHAEAIGLLHRQAEAGRWSLSVDGCAEALHRSVASRFRGETPAPAIVEAYLQSLRVQDLALAWACAAGDEQAWEDFVETYRPKLYAAARAIAGEAGRELADSLYADLYGISERRGRRRSLFEYFHGRSALGTWLRAVLAQRHVDLVRSGGRSVPLDDRSDTARMVSSSGPRDPDRHRYLALLQATVVAALSALPPRDRLRLAYYYVQDLTLAEVGRLLGEHESTVSRKLAATRRVLRREVERGLKVERGLTEAQIAQCLEYATGEWPFDLEAVLVQSDT